MSKRRDLERHLHSLGEIKDIMNAMKNLALMETRKLTRVLATQRRVTNDIAAAAADFLSFHPGAAGAPEPANDIWLLLGAERGFCGDFNEAVSGAAAERAGDAPRVAIGSRLGERLADDPRVVARLAGPSVLEEVEPVLLKLMETIDAHQRAQSPPLPLRLTVVHHAAAEGDVRVSPLRPFAEPPAAPAPTGYPPCTNLEAPVLLAELTEQYLFAALHGTFYDSLMAENQRRVQHMERAVRRIEQDCAGLALKRNSLRQEEITEEIEVIMLSLGDVVG